MWLKEKFNLPQGNKYGGRKNSVEKLDIIQTRLSIINNIEYKLILKYLPQ